MRASNAQAKVHPPLALFGQSANPRRTIAAHFGLGQQVCRCDFGLTDIVGDWANDDGDAEAIRTE